MTAPVPCSIEASDLEDQRAMTITRRQGPGRYPIPVGRAPESWNGRKFVMTSGAFATSIWSPPEWAF